MTSNKLSVRDLAIVAIGAALIAVCSWLSVPFAVPFTLQSFAVCLLAALLGWKRGLLTVLVYMLLGAVGLPVFAGFKGGFGVLLTALVIGLCTDRFGRKPLPLALAMALGMLLCYACGTAWFVIVYTRSSGPIGVLGALSWCVFPFLIPDALKCALALPLARRLYSVVNKR